MCEYEFILFVLIFASCCSKTKWSFPLQVEKATGGEKILQKAPNAQWAMGFGSPSFKYWTAGKKKFLSSENNIVCCDFHVFFFFSICLLFFFSSNKTRNLCLIKTSCTVIPLAEMVERGETPWQLITEKIFRLPEFKPGYPDVLWNVLLSLECVKKWNIQYIYQLYFLVYVWTQMLDLLELPRSVTANEACIRKMEATAHRWATHKHIDFFIFKGMCILDCNRL